LTTNSQTMSDKRKKKFKAYDQDQGFLLPPYLDDLIPEKHLVRVINRVMNSIRVEDLYNQFSDLGCSAYHPLAMLKSIVYGYCQKIYSTRRIAQAMRQDVTFMWLSGMQTPGFRTVGRFRSEYLKDMMEEVFTDVLDLLHQEGYVKFEEYFVDGTMIEADANKYSHVWLKNTDRYKKAVRERVHGLLDEIERINKEEDSRYGDQDLEEMGETSTLTSEKIKELSDRINKKLQEKRDQKRNQADRKVQSCLGKLAKESENLAKYEEQERIADGRNSFSKTDEDATFNRMKDDSLKPSYNWQVSSENQFVTNFSVAQNAADCGNFPDHLQKIVERGEEYLPDNYVGDMGYGTEENYLLLAENGVDSYLKYPGFFRETKTEYKNNPFARPNLPYDQNGDFFVCPAGKKLGFSQEREETSKRGFKFVTRTYVCENCSGCSLREQCTKSQENRTLTVNRRLDAFRNKTRENLNSEIGIELRKRRGFEIETFFGDLKHNQGYRRVRLRSLPKANLELAWLCIGYNLRKLHIKELNMN
jgi:transposase